MWAKALEMKHAQINACLHDIWRCQKFDWNNEKWLLLLGLEKMSFTTNMQYQNWFKHTELKFLYSEKAAKFCKTSIVDLSYVMTVKSTVEISQTFLAFSGYMNFKANPRTYAASPAQYHRKLVRKQHFLSKRFWSLLCVEHLNQPDL